MRGCVALPLKTVIFRESILETTHYRPPMVGLLQPGELSLQAGVLSLQPGVRGSGVLLMNTREVNPTDKTFKKTEASVCLP